MMEDKRRETSKGDGKGVVCPRMQRALKGAHGQQPSRASLFDWYLETRDWRGSSDGQPLRPSINLIVWRLSSFSQQFNMHARNTCKKIVRGVAHSPRQTLPRVNRMVVLARFLDADPIVVISAMAKKYF
jgi:hypothetical protein